MCLVAYSDSLPALIHEEVMRCLESNAGQTAENFAEALFRVIMKDGTNALTSLHTGGYIKKVATTQVILTPNAATKVTLEEVNNILTQMAQGKEANKKMEQLTKPNKKSAVPEPSNTVALTDDDLAQQRREQSARMRKQAAELLIEADTLDKEAAELSGEQTPTVEGTDAITKPKRAVANARKKAPTAKS
jgi:hypothetical protein